MERGRAKKERGQQQRKQSEPPWCVRLLPCAFSTGSARALEKTLAPLCSPCPALSIRARKRGPRDTKKSGKRGEEREEKEETNRGRKKRTRFSSLLLAHLLVASTLLGDVALCALSLEDLLAAGEVWRFFGFSGEEGEKEEKEVRRKRKRKRHGADNFLVLFSLSAASEPISCCFETAARCFVTRSSTLRRRKGQIVPRGLVQGRRRLARGGSDDSEGRRRDCSREQQNAPSLFLSLVDA